MVKVTRTPCFNKVAWVTTLAAVEREAWTTILEKIVVGPLFGVQLALCQPSTITASDLEKDSLKFFGGPARIRTGDRQVSLDSGYEPAALSVL